MKLRRWIYPILFIGAMFLVFVSSADAEVMNWKIRGVQRQAIVFAPIEKNDSGKAPLVFVFHGHGYNMENFALETRIPTVWPEAIVVYMQGLPTDASADPQGFGWIYETGPDGQRDLMFFDAVLETMRAKFSVDNRRIYATGFSNGAMFTYVLWGTRANIFAAFAAVAGRIVPAVHLSEPKPLLHVASEEDRTVPYKEQVQAIRVARALNGTSEVNQSCGEGCTMYPSSKGAPVVTYIHDGGHVYPPGTSEMIVRFFKNYSLAPHKISPTP